MIKRLIFDVDNTLIRNVNFVESVKNTLVDLSIYSKEHLDGFLKGINTYESLYNNYNKVDYTKHMSKCINYQLEDNFLETFFKHLKNAIPERNETLIKKIDQLASKYELVLLTNYFGQSQINRLNGMGIGKFFSECYGETLIKPNIDAYLTACGEHNTNECIMIGDNFEIDILGAENAGIKGILLDPNNKYDYKNKINNLKDLEELL